jgi:hypothetical protein
MSAALILMVFLDALSLAVDKTKKGCPLSHKQVEIITKLIRWPTDICYPGELAFCF